MKFIGLKNNIITGVMIATRFSQPRGNLPILSNIYLQIKKSGLIIKATNLESSAVIEVRGIGEEEGDFTVNAKLFSDYLINIPEEKIELTVEDKKLIIHAGKYKTLINGIEAADFPILSEIEDGEVFEVETSFLNNALIKTIFATSAQEMRQEFSGLFFSFNKNILTIAATDSFRLAEQKIPYSGSGEYSSIIPHKTLQEVLKICEQSNEKNTRIIFKQGEAVFQVGLIKIFSRLIDGQYPEYQAIIPAQTNTVATVKTQEIIHAVKTASLFSQNGLFDVNLKIDPKKKIIKISSRRSDVGEHTAEIDGIISGEAVDIVLNYKYLLDYLARVQKDETEFLIASAGQPVKMRPKNDKDYLYLIMPIRQ